MNCGTMLVVLFFLGAANAQNSSEQCEECTDVTNSFCCKFFTLCCEDHHDHHNVTTTEENVSMNCSIVYDKQSTACSNNSYGGSHEHTNHP